MPPSPRRLWQSNLDTGQGDNTFSFFKTGKIFILNPLKDDTPPSEKKR